MRRTPLSICDRYDWLMACPTLSLPARDLLLRHCAIQAAQTAFHFPEILEFFA